MEGHECVWCSHSSLPLCKACYFNYLWHVKLFHKWCRTIDPSIIKTIFNNHCWYRSYLHWTEAWCTGAVKFFLWLQNLSKRDWIFGHGKFSYKSLCVCYLDADRVSCSGCGTCLNLWVWKVLFLCWSCLQWTGALERRIFLLYFFV